MNNTILQIGMTVITNDGYLGIIRGMSFQAGEDIFQVNIPARQKWIWYFMEELEAL